jgi:hypothetical protein
MNLQERIARYLERNFREDQAHILVLMEEAAIALFSALPEHFVLIGGATLVLFHNSPRLSKDLDLLARDEALPGAEELEEALRARLGEVAGILGIGPVAFERESVSENFLRLWIVKPGKQRLFTVDVVPGGRRGRDRGRGENSAHSNRFAGLFVAAESGVVRVTKDHEIQRRVRHPSVVGARSETQRGAEGSFARRSLVARNEG